MVGHTHTVRVSRGDWIAVEDTHEGIVTREEFDRAQAEMRTFPERSEIKRHDWPLYGKVRCGVCGYAMGHNRGKQMYFYCRTVVLRSIMTPFSVLAERLKLIFWRLFLRDFMCRH